MTTSDLIKHSLANRFELFSGCRLFDENITEEMKLIFPNDRYLARRQEIVGELSHLGNLI